MASCLSRDNTRYWKNWYEGLTKDTYLDTVSAEAQHIESGSNIDTIVENTFKYDTRRLNIGRAAITTFAIISAGYIGGYLVNLGGGAAVVGGSIQVGANGYVVYLGGKTVYESAPKIYEAFKNGHTIEALKYTGITALGVLGVVTGGSGVVKGVKNISKVVSPLLKGPSVGVGNKGGSGSKYEITWNKTINATQEVTEGTNIPKSFKIKGLNVNGKEVWVHGNATKHMGEYVNSAKGSIIIENEMMLSFQETISQILPEVKLERNFFNINGWEIGINGDTGVIYHALYK